MEIIIISIVVVILLFFVISGYNKFVATKEAADTAHKEIDIQLDRRGKVFDSLISAVKKYMEHERGVFSEIAALRSNALENKGTKEGREAEDKLSKIVSSGQLESSINIAVENYPDLKSQENMLQLQEEIVSTENKLSFAKKGYNMQVEKYQILKRSFPSNLIPMIFSSLNVELERWQITEEQRKLEESKRVEF